MTSQHLWVLTQTPVWEMLFKEWAWRFLTENSDTSCLRNWGFFLQRPRHYEVLMSWVKCVKYWGIWDELGLEVDLNPLTKTCCSGVEPELNFNLFFSDSLEMTALHTWKKPWKIWHFTGSRQQRAKCSWTRPVGITQTKIPCVQCWGLSCPPPPWPQCVLHHSSSLWTFSTTPASTLICSLQSAMSPEAFWGSFANHQGLNLLAEEAVKLLGLRFSRWRSENQDGCRDERAWSIPDTPSLPPGRHQGTLPPAQEAPWNKHGTNHGTNNGTTNFPVGNAWPHPSQGRYSGKGVQTPAEFIGKCYHWLKQAWAAGGTRSCHGNSLLMCPGFETTFPSSPALSASFLPLFCRRFAFLGWGGAGGLWGPERSCPSQGGLWGWENLPACRDPAKWGLDGPWRVTVLWEQGRTSQGNPSPIRAEMLWASVGLYPTGVFISVVTLLHPLTPLGNGGSDGKPPLGQWEIKPVPWEVVLRDKRGPTPSSFPTPAWAPHLGRGAFNPLKWVKSSPSPVVVWLCSCTEGPLRAPAKLWGEFSL